MVLVVLKVAGASVKLTDEAKDGDQAMMPQMWKGVDWGLELAHNSSPLRDKMMSRKKHRKGEHTKALLRCWWKNHRLEAIAEEVL